MTIKHYSNTCLNRLVKPKRLFHLSNYFIWGSDQRGESGEKEGPDDAVQVMNQRQESAGVWQNGRGISGWGEIHCRLVLSWNQFSGARFICSENILTVLKIWHWLQTNTGLALVEQQKMSWDGCTNSFLIKETTNPNYRELILTEGPCRNMSRSVRSAAEQRSI